MTRRVVNAITRASSEGEMASKDSIRLVQSFP